MRALIDPPAKPDGAEEQNSTGLLLERRASALRLPTPEATKG